MVWVRERAARLTVFAVIPRAAHRVTHAALSELAAGEADLRTGSAGGTRAVLVGAALLVLRARVWLREGAGRGWGPRAPRTTLPGSSRSLSAHLAKNCCHSLLPKAVARRTFNYPDTARSEPSSPGETRLGSPRSRSPRPFSPGGCQGSGTCCRPPRECREPRWRPSLGARQRRSAVGAGSWWRWNWERSSRWRSPPAEGDRKEPQPPGQPRPGQLPLCAEPSSQKDSRGREKGERRTVASHA